MGCALGGLPRVAGLLSLTDARHEGFQPALLLQDVDGSLVGIGRIVVGTAAVLQ